MAMEKKSHRNHYAELAAFLNPANPAAGAREVDEAILATLRYRSRNRNIATLCSWAGILFLSLGGLMLGLPLFDQLISDGATSMNFMVPVAACLLIIAGGLLYLLGERRNRTINVDVFLPETMQQWLAENDVTLRHWHHVYWPHWKRAANRRQLGSFTFWRSQLVDEQRYEKAEWVDQVPVTN
jgi:hypothetical protein